MRAHNGRNGFDLSLRIRRNGRAHATTLCGQRHLDINLVPFRLEVFDREIINQTEVDNINRYLRHGVFNGKFEVT